MKIVLCSFLLSFACVCVAQPQPQPQPAQKVSTPDIEDLGGQRYRVGEIEIDKAQGMFRVAGQVLRDAPPLEFLVVTRGGYKAYEAVLEVNADAFEFNLACILIGLNGSDISDYERDPNQPVPGDPVEVLVSWFKGDQKISVNGADLIAIGEPPRKVESGDWVYTGSHMLGDGQYMAELSGTLVGFVRRESIIEHKEGIGLGNYGGAIVNPEMMPPVGTKIELLVKRPGTVQ